MSYSDIPCSIRYPEGREDPCPECGSYWCVGKCGGYYRPCGDCSRTDKHTHCAECGDTDHLASECDMMG
jgi:hypothetical protein